MRQKYVLLDRDGVINYDSENYIKSPQEWHPIPESLEAISLLNSNGFKVVVISNQSGVARGLFDLATLEKIHIKMQHSAVDCGAEIEAFYFCPHGPEDGCICRKPKPGLLQQFAQEYDVELDNIPFIGDSLRDVQAARAIAARPMLVKTGKGIKTISDNPGLNVPIFKNLYDAAKFIVSEK